MRGGTRHGEGEERSQSYRSNRDIHRALTDTQDRRDEGWRDTAKHYTVVNTE